jgi:hypothetical protein
VICPRLLRLEFGLQFEERGSGFRESLFALRFDAMELADQFGFSAPQVDDFGFDLPGRAQVPGMLLSLTDRVRGSFKLVDSMAGQGQTSKNRIPVDFPGHVL